MLQDLLEGGQLNLINSQDSWGRTPLHAAAITENSECLQILLNTGADPNIQCDPRGEVKVFTVLSWVYLKFFTMSQFEQELISEFVI